jgi:hypothetical protein
MRFKLELARLFLCLVCPLHIEQVLAPYLYSCKID